MPIGGAHSAPPDLLARLKGREMREGGSGKRNRYGGMGEKSKVGKGEEGKEMGGPPNIVH